VEHELGVGDDGVPFDLGKLVWRSRERERERVRERARERERVRARESRRIREKG
jgi:hypothetical protein